MRQFCAHLRQVVHDTESRIGRHTRIALCFLDPSIRPAPPRRSHQLLMRVLTQFCASTNLSSARSSETPGQCWLLFDNFREKVIILLLSFLKYRYIYLYIDTYNYNILYKYIVRQCYILKTIYNSKVINGKIKKSNFFAVYRSLRRSRSFLKRVDRMFQTGN